MAEQNKMGTMPINRLLLTMALPMMASMLIQALYNVVDSIFVSRISEEALTAVSMAFPMQNLVIGVAAGLGVGTNAMLSRALGAGNRKRADLAAMQGVFLSICAYLLFLILGLTVTKVFYRAQGASETILQYGCEYLDIVMIFSFGMYAQFIFERLLQGTGRTLYTMFTQMTGALINIVLDPILIFGYFGLPAMGVRGAAVATVIGQIISGIFAFIMNKKKNTDITLSLRNMKPESEMCLKILKIGIPSVLMVAIGSIMTFSVNKILVVFTSTAVAVFGVYFKLQSFVFMPVFGLNNAVIPIVAFNYGAKRQDRMKQTLKAAMIFAQIIMTIACIVCQIIPGTLLSLFDASETMLAIGVPAMRIITLSFLAAGFCVISSGYFQALGFSVYSMIISFVRQLIFLVPLVWLFSKTGKVDIVWLAWPIAEIASIALCILLHRRLPKVEEQ